MAGPRNKSQTFDPIAQAHDAGIHSGYAYSAGFASVALAIMAWLVSRMKKDERAQADRWGIFIGHWAATFFLIGLALKHEEQ